MDKNFTIDWLIIYEICYAVALVLVCLRIIFDTRSNTKTLSYLLLAIFIPVLGMIFYFAFGTNYRKRKIYSKKIVDDDNLARRLKEQILHYSKGILAHGGADLHHNRELATLLIRDGLSPLTAGNDVKLLINGENKFPAVLSALRAARHHIHLEYYIYEDDETGRSVAAVLEQKAREGVEVRFIYDDFGSRSIRKKLVPRLRAAGVQVFPFYRIFFMAFANRLNYRNHRKIIVVDGQVGFVGGINISDRYVNKSGDAGGLYWRDTHLRIEGPGVYYLQYLFFSDWNFCSGQHLQPGVPYFHRPDSLPARGNKVVQIAASGPDSDTPTILFSLLQAINLAEKEILLTTPYFIPGESLMDALIVSALGGVSVKLLLPGVSDSLLVNTAARSYYAELLNAGVKIYLYRKGFIHAKTLVADGKVAIVGTANMDYRSFDLNFEVNAVVYDRGLAAELSQAFSRDLDDAEQLQAETWNNRPVYLQLLEKSARLISPLL